MALTTENLEKFLQKFFGFAGSLFQKLDGVVDDDNSKILQPSLSLENQGPTQWDVLLVYGLQDTPPQSKFLFGTSLIG